jgi:hypothetical protein
MIDILAPSNFSPPTLNGGRCCTFVDFGGNEKKKQIRMKNLCFPVPYTEASSKITTVYNSSFVYKAIKKLKQLTNGVEETKEAGVSPTKYVLDNISLCLKPGKM